MSVFTTSPVEAIQGTIGLLGADQVAIKVYFNGFDELSKYGDALNDPALAPDLTNEDAWTQDEIDTVMSALGEIETLIDVGFQLTTNRAEADLDFIKNDNFSGTGGIYSYLTDVDGTSARRSTVVINHTIEDPLTLYRDPWSGGYDIGTFGYQTLLFVLGGALGLGFPFNTGNGTKILEGLSPDEPFFAGPHGLNDSINSVMAQGIGYDFYDTVGFGAGARGSMGAWDIAALQALYGAQAGTNAGDDVYTLTDSFLFEDAYYKTIYDTAGTDTLFYDGFSDVKLDLRAATLDLDPETSGGPVSFYLAAGDTLGVDGFTIAQGTVIENATGDLGDDTLIGNDAQNVLRGNGGADLILPGLGQDSLDGGAGRDEYAGTVAELYADVILSIADLDRIFVYDVLYDDSDVSVINEAGVDYLVADTGAPGEALVMVLDAGIGLSAGQYNLFTTHRGGDSIITFAQSDDFGDTIATAEPFSVEGLNLFDPDDGIAYGIIETAGDVDMFDNFDTKFNDLLIEVLGTSASGGTLANPVIEIFDDAGVLAFSDAGTGPAGAARITIPAFDPGFAQPAIDYYIKVSGGAGETGTYTLRAIIADDHADDVPVNYNPTLTPRTTLTLSNTPVTAELETAGDTDVFRIEMAAGATYTLSATGLLNRFGSSVDTQITLFKEGGQQVALDNNSGPGTDAHLSFTPSEAGNYFYAITAGTTASSGATGFYELGLAISDDYAGTPLEAEVVNPNSGTFSGITEHGGDKDFWAIWLVEGETYNFDAIVPLTGNTMTLYAPRVAVLDETSVNFFGQDIDYTASETGLHYLAMATTFGVGENNYDITITGGPAGIVGTGSANDLFGDSDDNFIVGLGGADTVRGQAGDDFLRGGNGDDLAYAGDGNDLVQGENGNDALWGQNGDDRLQGNAGADTLKGNEGDDTLEGGVGNDVVFGGFGADSLLGGAGDDTLDGGDGDDTIQGADGHDLIVGGSQSDLLFGGNGNDTLRGEGADDEIHGDAGNDLIFGSSGEDTLFGGADNDVMEGNAQADLMFGESGDDTLRGDDGFDALFGGDGRDVLAGGNGADTLAGGGGQDTLRGNAGDDTFVFEDAAQSGFGAGDLIDGFTGAGSAGGDVIDLSGIDADVFAFGDQAFTFLGVQTTAQGLAAGAGSLWLENVSGQTRVYGSVDNDGTVDLAIRINDGGVIAASYAAGDFVL